VGYEEVMRLIEPLLERTMNRLQSSRNITELF